MKFMFSNEQVNINKKKKNLINKSMTEFLLYTFCSGMSNIFCRQALSKQEIL